MAQWDKGPMAQWPFGTVVIVFVAVLTSSIVYFYCFKGTKKDVSEAVVTNKFKGVYFLPFILAKISPNITPERNLSLAIAFLCLF